MGEYGRWFLDIETSDGDPVRYGLCLVEDSPITEHLDLEDFEDGILIVFQAEADNKPASRNNLGINKSYELVFVPSSEMV